MVNNMNQELRIKYEKLKERNKIIAIEKSWKDNMLLQECIGIIEGEVLEYEEGLRITDDIQIKILFLNGRVDFDEFKYQNNINDISSIETLVDANIDVYIMWDQFKLPCLKSKLSQIIRHIDDVACVSFDTWIVSVDYNIVIEIYHEGEITLGILS